MHTRATERIMREHTGTLHMGSELIHAPAQDQSMHDCPVGACMNASFLHTSAPRESTHGHPGRARMSTPLFCM